MEESGTSPQIPPTLVPLAQLAETLCAFIADQATISFRYNDGLREVDPYAVGENATGALVLHAWQRRGASASGQPFGWKYFQLGRIEGPVRVTGHFTRLRSDYRLNPQHLPDVLCWLEET